MDFTKIFNATNLGWGTVIAGVIAIIVGIMNYFSPERVKQRLRVEQFQLKAEKTKIENSEPTTASAARLLVIEKRLNEISTYLGSQ